MVFRNYNRASACCTTCLMLLLTAAPLNAEETPASPPVQAKATQVAFFESQVRPLLAKHCIACHGPKKQHAELRLDSRQAMLQGGESGAAITPYKPGESLLIEAVRRESFEMPPEEELAPKEISILATWIKQGAVWPASDTDLAADAAPDFAAHWAFQPIGNPPVPEASNTNWPKNAIDHFILAKLKQAGLAPAPEASRVTLLRRMKWDLVGLPLTADELNADDLNPNRPHDDQKTINALLASPHYGERWGRHWLDIARYADTKGYVFFEKPDFRSGFTYRDYVIQSFNNDKPFNQFVREQLAADLLPEKTPHESLAALGFITIGPHLKNEIHDIMADRIDVVSRGFLGLTVGCARCHDHKYDPISIQDYYSFYGIFRNALEPIHLPFRVGGNIPEQYRKAAAHIEQTAHDLQEHYQKQYQTVLKQGRERLAEYLAAAQAQRSGPDTTMFDMVLDGDDLNPQLLLFWQQYLEDQDTNHDPVFLAWNQLAPLPSQEFASNAGEVLKRLAAKPNESSVNRLVLQRLMQQPLKNFEQVVQVYVQLLNENDATEQKANAASVSNPASSKADIQAAGEQNTRDQEQLRRVLHGAESPLQAPLHRFKLLRLFPDRKSQKKVNALNAAVDAARAKAPVALAQMLVLKDAKTIIEPRVFRRGNAARPAKYVTRRYLRFFDKVSNQPFTIGSGRLELANAIVAPNNPLTARVIVNRIWQHHFGQGLVRTPSNFGMQSEPPSHPELLDHLASWFINHGWSIKQLHRYIMQSATYRQSSVSRPEGERIDPENRLCWRMNRQRMDLETMRDALLAVSGTLDLTVGGPSVAGAIDGANNRRTLYTRIDRQNLPGIMRTFDFPPPDVSSATRNSTTVPGQALFLMNHPLVQSAAQKLSEVAQSKSDRAAGVRYLFRTVLSRDPTATELGEMLAYLEADAQPSNTPTELAHSAWQYGYGAFDEAKQQLTKFEPLPYWTGDQYRGGVKLPDAKLGWIFLTATGGHPGNTLKHAAVIRWTAPQTMTVSLSGIFKHAKKPGDGVRGRVFAAGKPLLGPWIIHQQSVDTNVAKISLQKGETLDFIVDIYKILSFDSFEWSPEIKILPSKIAANQGAGPKSTPQNRLHPQSWNYGHDFHPPASAKISAWRNLAQVLLLSNEFQFVD